MAMCVSIATARSPAWPWSSARLRDSSRACRVASDVHGPRAEDLTELDHVDGNVARRADLRRDVTRDLELTCGCDDDRTLAQGDAVQQVRSGLTPQLVDAVVGMTDVIAQTGRERSRERNGHGTDPSEPFRAMSTLCAQQQ